MANRPVAENNTETRNDLKDLIKTDSTSVIHIVTTTYSTNGIEDAKSNLHKSTNNSPIPEAKINNASDSSLSSKQPGPIKFFDLSNKVDTIPSNPITSNNGNEEVTVAPASRVQEFDTETVTEAKFSKKIKPSIPKELDIARSTNVTKVLESSTPLDNTLQTQSNSSFVGSNYLLNTASILQKSKLSTYSKNVYPD